MCRSPKGSISREQLAIALERQKTSGRRLGEELIKAGFVKRSVVNRALRMQRSLGVAAVCSIAMSTLLAPDVRAAAQGRMLVTATVPARAVSELQAQQAEITLSPADVARGYVDVAVGSRLKVSANGREGYAVDFFPRLSIFKSVQIRTSSADARIGPDGGTMIVRGRHGRKMPVDLSYRFELREHIAPGTYPWPLALSVRPL
ncbi:MAG TPA: hypothetical protein VMQ50_00290 [Casimicrobiaceae bacterium]|nr:hypothetical protein [Casimicrobiaceae bacterium]